MSDEQDKKEEIDEPTMVVSSSRFGDLEVPQSSLIKFPVGLIGFPRAQGFIMLEHKPPFSWLQSVDDPNLAFVVVDGFEFGENYNVKPPTGDPVVEFKEDDEYAILVIVTVRPDPSMTTANLKAPLFVNLRTRCGLQVIFDDQRFSTRHPLWGSAEEGQTQQPEPEKKGEGEE
ncbi:MAG: hypothetical protein D6719_04910 [Candidatus Dadabacteria bacterium]|nr:MAG: hypothetical protein D6719_04910 [Candidatus Dadabacteria bacterium]